ncbi:capsid and scaffold protein [Lactococcus phage CHPC1175]|nr:capsid and scaffold protein [Lactococcus phage CHPC1175]
MLINVLNGSLKKVAILSNELPNAPSYYNDEFHDYLEQGATTFSFTVAKVINNQLQDYTQFLSDQSYFSFRKNGRDYLMTPSSEQSVHETSTEISFFCVSLDRELINEQANSLANTASHNIQWYFDRMGLISRTKITIGINEVSNLTRVINYDAQESKLSRLISVINNFNAEFDFVTTLNNDGSLGTVVLNIYKENDGQNIQGVGTKRDDVRLTFGKNIEDVEVDVSDDGFFNAAYMTGADGFSWKNYDFSYKNSDGVEEFYKRKGSEIAYAPLSAKMFPSQLKTDKGDIWTNSDRTTEYKNANDMWGYIVSQFKQYAYKQITYTVTPSSTLVNQLIGDGRPLQKGDTVIIQDDNYMDIDGNVGLILSARVSEIITSDTNPANNKIVFSNYKKLKSEASSDIKAIVSQLVNDATPYFADIATSNGVQFKNGTGSTTLSAHIYKGSATTEATADSYEWSKDGTVVAPTQTITVDASGVADKAVYSFKATVAGKVVASQSVTITNVNDGTNGRSVTNVSQKWRLTTTTATPTQAWSDAGWLTTQPTTTATNKYLWSITRTTFNLAPLTQDVIEQKAVYGDKGDKGDTGNDGRAGKDGVGINSTTITYAISSSGTVTPTAGWNSQVPTLVKGQYLWTKTVWNYSDGTSESGYTVSYIAKDGNNGNDGIAGKDGTGIKTTTITYAGSTSGTTAPTSGWTSTVPTVAAGSYLWTKTVWAYTDNTSETGYSVAMMGVKGDKGDQGIQGVDGRQGIPGPKGADGKTQYTHIAYANSADGSKDFSTSDSNRTYIGMYVDFNINDSTTPSDYSWTLVKGADGTQGTPGKPGTDGKTPYFHTAWSYSADGTDGFTTVYPNLNLGDNTKTFVGAEYELSNIRGSIIIDPATQKTQDGDINYLTFKPTRDGYDWFRFYLRPNSTMPNMTKVAIKPNTIQINLTSEWKIYTFTVTSSNVIPDRDVQFFIRSNNGTEINLKYPKVEEGSTATPYMQSASEVTTADYPSYIGQYTDFAQADSTNPSAYTWSLIRGNDGERGPQGLKGDPGATGIPGQPGADGKTSYLHIAYATNSTGTAGFDVSNATGKTYIGQYTDFMSADSTDPSKYTWSLIKGDKGDKGERGIQGPAGSNGDPGKIVSDTEPTTRFKGLTWKYLGMSDLTASDGTVILSGTEYYWSGTNWILNEINAHNINGDNLSVTNGTFTDGKIKSTWNSGTASGSTEIENSHINMSATNSSSKVTNSLGLDIKQGFGMRWTDPASNQSKSVLLDYGNLAFDRNGVAAGLNFDGTNLSSSMPIQAPNTIVKSTQFSVSGIGIRLDRMMSFVAVTFSGQASSTIKNSPTIINVLPDGFRPISPYSIDYIVPGNTANNGYIYFNPDGSIRIMATINSGYYIRGTRFYITNDVYPS